MPSAGGALRLLTLHGADSPSAQGPAPPQGMPTPQTGGFALTKLRIALACL